MKIAFLGRGEDTPPEAVEKPSGFFDKRVAVCGRQTLRGFLDTLGRGEDTPPFFRSKACGVRADVGSELSAAGGRGSEVSEWPRSKFPASAVRQRRNFGHRNRIIGPYGCFIRCTVSGVIWLRYGRRNIV